MIEQIEGLPDGVVGFEAIGDVTVSDYDDFVTPLVERARASHDKIRLLHVIGERVSGHSASAVLEDARLGLANVRSIERIAVVTDIRRFRAFVKAAGWSLPGDLKLFSNAERAEAEAWISEGLRPAQSSVPPDSRGPPG